MTKPQPIVQAVAPRPASTVILVRAGSGEPEVLLMKRGATARFMPDAYVFAGGAVDCDDSIDEMYGCAAGMDDPRASGILGLSKDGLAFYVAAVRETFEECGLLLAYDGTGRPVNPADWTEPGLRQARTQLSSGAVTFAGVCRKHGWRLAVDQLYYFAHWITPVSLPKRFDTRFFIALSPAGQQASLSGEEMSEFVWLPPKQAIRDHEHGRLLIMKATRAMLDDIARFDDLDELLEFARAPRRIPAVLPVIPPGSGIP